MKKVFCIILAVFMVSFSGCEYVNNLVKDIKGELIGNSFNVYFYDNYGQHFLTAEGDKIGVSANKIQTTSLNSDGEISFNSENSSVITITIDGNNMEQVGNTVIFEEKGISKLNDFSLPKEISGNGGTINIIDRNINEIKNMLGTEKVVVVCSQLGIPIAVYGGNSVYWEIPSDLPKMTKLSVDGKALYIHRANYVMFDTNLIK